MPKIIEEFMSIQGEGLFAGIPSYFIRLANCTLRCPWCDTKYSWKPEERNPDLKPKVIDNVGIKSIQKMVNPEHIVITGGEPTIFIDNDQFVEFVRLQLIANKIVTIETTTLGKMQYLRSSNIIEVLKHFDSKFEDLESKPYYMVSPKLDIRCYQGKEFSIQNILDYYSIRLLKPNDSFIGRFYYKFVYENQFKKNILTIINDSPDWFRKYITSMAFTPIIEDEIQFRKNCEATAVFCMDQNIRYSSRIHIDIWGTKKGV